MNCQNRVFPSSERRGGCAIKKMLRSLLMKAQPPLLFQEGNTLSWRFVHTFYERRFSAVIDRRYRQI